MNAGINLHIPIQTVVARRFHAPIDGFVSNALPTSILPRANPVQGWLVGASDGKLCGWWGPVSRQIAEYAVSIFEAIDRQEPTTPDDWGERARRCTRHAHAGLGSVAVGAFELAAWDLAGQRADRPVWALFRETPAVSSIEGYATCFGFDPREKADRNLVEELAARGWRCQKWHPPDGDGKAVDELNNRAGGNERIALDFGGRWSKEKVSRFLAEVSCRLAWIEEPLPPWQLSELGPLLLRAPVAAGEHCYGPHETVMLEAAGISIWQPDAVFCGGWGNLVRIANRAERVGARCIPHGGGLLPALHAAACGVQIELVEWHLVVEPKRQAHLADPVLPVETPFISVPDRPGWAGRLNRDVTF